MLLAMEWCEANGINYVFGLAGSRPLSAKGEATADAVRTERALTGKAVVRGYAEIRLVQLDQVFGLAPRAVQAVVEPLRRAEAQIGDDEADVEAEGRGLDAGDGTALVGPGLRLVAPRTG